MIEAPQKFVVRHECEQAAGRNGFRRVLGEEAGWAVFSSTTAQGTIRLAAAGPQGPWFLALDHAGIITELGQPLAGMPGPGRARYAFDTLGTLYAALHRVYELGVSLPDAPLRTFQLKVKALPQTTEAERLVVQRIGQDIFRASLMDYWQGRCPLTGIADPALLRASHIVPWAECTDEQCLDVHNGLLLSALWDAAFDKGLVSFAHDGTPLANPGLSDAARLALGFDRMQPLCNLRDAHRTNLTAHRARHCF
jgi:hypothetical protein